MSGREFRVVYKREGLVRKVRRYATEVTARRLLTLLTGDEPWTAYGQDPDSFVCCQGDPFCGCGGETVREWHRRIREEVPRLEYAHLESRPVGEWTDCLPSGRTEE